MDQVDQPALEHLEALSVLPDPLGHKAHSDQPNPTVYLVCLYFPSDPFLPSVHVAKYFLMLPSLLLAPLDQELQPAQVLPFLLGSLCC